MDELDKSKVIIDASIALAWILPDEHTSPKVNELYAQSAQGELTLSAPVLLLFEVINGLKSAVLRKRLTPHQAHEALMLFLSLEIELMPMTELSTAILTTALTLNISSYDASYIALAQNLKSTLWTTDTKLARKASPRITTTTV